MDKLNKKTRELKAGNRGLYSALVLASCVGLFVITVRFHLDRILLCTVDHLVP